MGAGVLTFISYFVLMLALLIAMIVVSIPLAALGFGGLVLVDVAGVTLTAAIITYLLALLLWYLAAVVFSLALGRLILARVTAPWARDDYAPLLLGVLLVVVAGAIPFVGGLLNALLVAAGLGALTMALWPLGRTLSPTAVA